MQNSAAQPFSATVRDHAGKVSRHSGKSFFTLGSCCTACLLYHQNRLSVHVLGSVGVSVHVLGSVVAIYHKSISGCPSRSVTYRSLARSCVVHHDISPRKAPLLNQVPYCFSERERER